MTVRHSLRVTPDSDSGAGSELLSDSYDTAIISVLHTLLPYVHHRQSHAVSTFLWVQHINVR